MKLPMDGIQAFVEIAELGTFSRAAEKLGITQTALTRRIQRLEAFIGVQLLDRTTRSTSLTQVGREFLPLSMRLVADLTFGLDQLRAKARLSVGEVTIATLQSIAFHQLPLVLQLYGQAYPHNRVEILERSGTLVTDAVRQGHADFGIHIQQEPQSDLSEDLLMRDPFVLVCSESHRFASARTIGWSELRDVDLITLGGSSGNRRMIETQLMRAGLETRGRFVVETTPTAVALANAGVGVAILPATMNATSVARGLVEVPIIDPVVYRSIGLVKRRNQALTPAASALYAIVATELSR
ncbi:MAG: LysR family transcriptional regulator [Tardiphaga sp.]|nr:LysR family transcriptional regulator [Tardiphaga sp.]